MPGSKATPTGDHCRGLMLPLHSAALPECILDPVRAGIPLARGCSMHGGTEVLGPNSWRFIQLCGLLIRCPSASDLTILVSSAARQRELFCSFRDLGGVYQSAGTSRKEWHTQMTEAQRCGQGGGHVGDIEVLEPSFCRLSDTGSHYHPQACKTGAGKENSREVNKCSHQQVPRGRDVKGLESRGRNTQTSPSSHLPTPAGTFHWLMPIRNQRTLALSPQGGASNIQENKRAGVPGVHTEKPIPR